MKKFPIFIQADAMDCGPTCLRMISSYHGRHYTLDTLRSYASVGRDGVSLLGISRAAEAIGFRTLGGRFTLNEFVEKGPFPCIVHWDQEHFVVVLRIKKDKRNNTFYVADPAKGLMKYSQEEFISHWISTSTNKEEKARCWYKS